MVGINEFDEWVVGHGGRIETSHPQNWADVSVGVDALAEFIELARQDGMNDAKKNTGYLGEKAVEGKTFTFTQGNECLYRTFSTEAIKAIYVGEEEVDRKEYIEKLLEEAGKKALFEKCVIDTTPIVDDGEVLDMEEWVRKAIWKVPDWLSKDELADLFLLKTDLAARAYKKLRDKTLIGNSHEYRNKPIDGNAHE